MKTLTSIAVSSYLAIGLLASLTTQSLAAADADLLFVGNHVITMQSGKRHAQPLAVAVTGETISWLGSPEQAGSVSGPNTKIIELGEQALLPGFIDAHGHISFVGASSLLANVASPPVGPVEDMDDLVVQLQTYISANNIPEGEWVIGRGYDDSLLKEGRHPTRDDLDRVSTRHPVGLIHVSGHLAATNSKGLARAGINAESIDPAGGLIRRRTGSTEPNGVLEETATSRISQHMAAAIKDPLEAVAVAMQEYAKNGITTAQDGGSSQQSIDLLRAADAAGHINLDIVAFPHGQGDEKDISSRYAFGDYVGRVKVGGVKLMLDGSPQGKTAYMTEPYLIPPDGQAKDYRGYPNIPQTRVSALVKHYLDASIPVIAHANGDAAADMLIQAVREAQQGQDHRTVMIHAQTVREDQLTDMKTLAMIPSYFAAHSFYWGDWHRDSVFGVERAQRISPTATTLARGMWFTVHNDSPVVPPDMMRLLWATTNRITRSGKVLGADQRISTIDALRAVTYNAAYQHFEEHIKGSLEVGKQADFVVLSTNPLLIPSTDLLSVKINATFARGKQVY
ncbi:MAG: putative amidohydrolase YtcJ [Limisphaerales bacterium]|jgi:predicted amidohydrolase YtcJ